MDIILIAAVAKNRCIGRDGRLVWYDRTDLDHFRLLTTGNPVLMGRATWESLPASLRPLPKRRNLVVSRTLAKAHGAEIHRSIEAALDQLTQEAASRVFIIGGAEIYRQTIARATRLELTEIDADLEGDAFFPAYDNWRSEANEPHAGFRFVTYTRPTKEVQPCP